jgi:hypothetical protein
MAFPMRPGSTLVCFVVLVLQMAFVDRSIREHPITIHCPERLFATIHIPSPRWLQTARVHRKAGIGCIFGLFVAARCVNEGSLISTGDCFGGCGAVSREIGYV